MSNFGHVKRVTRSVGGKEITFRSLFEYRYCVYLQVLKEGGEIQEWWYESPDWLFTFQYGRLNNTKQYLPDFAVLHNDGSYEIAECKGYFPSIDYTKIKAFVDHYEEQLVSFTLVFARPPSKTKGQLLRAQKLEKYFDGTENRIIWNADKDIFKRIAWRFDE